MPDTRAFRDLRVVADETEPVPSAPPVVDIVIPVYNEAAVIEASVARLYDYLRAEFPFSWRVTIVDNASTDGTWFRASRLARDAGDVRAIHLDEKGRGRALRRAWSTSDAAVVAYMDVDLSTDLDALLPLIAPLVSGHSDVAIGSRLTAGASVARRPKRELISRTYNMILHAVFATTVSDAQCGFKAVRTDVARSLLPAVADESWFFDTELLLLAEHNGLRIHEVPVDWIDDSDSRVHVAKTALADLAGTARVAWTFMRGRGRVDLGDAVRPRLTDDFGRGIVSLGLVTAMGAAVAAVSFLLLDGLVGTRWATTAAVAAGATVVGRRLALLRTTSRAGWIR